MATQLSKYGDISPRTAGFATKKLLERGQHLVVLERFGQVDPQGKNKTDTRKYRRYNNLQRATAPLAEGVTPAGQKLTYTDISVTLEQYGDVVTLTDKVLDTHEDAVMDEAVKIMAEQIAETVEVLRFNVLKAGTNVFYSGTATTRATVNGTLSRADLRKIVRTFNRNKARKISEIVGATAKISTQPVEAAFFAVCHTDLIPDIRALTGFIPVAQYSDSMKAMPGEVGACEDIRFVCTALMEAWAAAGTAGTTYLANGIAPAASTAADVYPILIFAKDAYAMVPLQGTNAVSIAVVNPKPVIGDELGQRGFASWKRYDATCILNQMWMARYEVACTATPAS